MRQLNIQHNERLKKRFDWRPAALSELDQLYQSIINPVFGFNTMKLDSLSALQEKNPAVVNLLERRLADRAPQLVGFASYFPLTETALNQLLNKCLQPIDIQPRHILDAPIDNKPVYVGGVAGIGGASAKAAGFVYFSEDLARMGRAYSRPITKAGMRALSRFGFVAVKQNEQGELCSFYTMAAQVASEAG